MGALTYWYYSEHLPCSCCVCKRVLKVHKNKAVQMRQKRAHKSPQKRSAPELPMLSTD